MVLVLYRQRNFIIGKWLFGQFQSVCAALGYISWDFRFSYSKLNLINRESFCMFSEKYIHKRSLFSLTNGFFMLLWAFFYLFSWSSFGSSSSLSISMCFRRVLCVPVCASALSLLSDPDREKDKKWRKNFDCKTINP